MQRRPRSKLERAGSQKPRDAARDLVVLVLSHRNIGRGDDVVLATMPTPSGINAPNLMGFVLF